MNYYELLGISKNASLEEIKNAYKKQMKKWHPDINKSSDATLMSSKINEAKEVLLNHEKRKEYDEYLSKKSDENYNKYTQNKKENKNDYKENDEYENKTVTKWQYLKDWIKYANINPIRKIIGLLGVMLETILCWLIKVILIITAFICNLGSDMIKELFSYISPILGILGILLISQVLTNGLANTYEENTLIVNGMLVFVIIFISSYLLPVFSNMILSPKVFDILYNKIDINLFKLCVGYKD